METTMEGMGAILIFILSSLLYLRIGVGIAGQSWGVWFSEDRQSWRSFLLFPVSCVTGRWDFAPICLLSVHPRRGLDGVNYTFCLSLFWPVKILWNFPVCIVLGVCWYCWRTVTDIGQALLTWQIECPAEPDPALPGGKPARLAAQAAETTSPLVEAGQTEKAREPTAEQFERELASLLIERRGINRRIRELQILLSQERGSGKFPRVPPSEEN